MILHFFIYWEQILKKCGCMKEKLFEKYIGDPLFLWGFGLFLALSLAIFHQVEIRIEGKNSGGFHTYHVSYQEKENPELVETQGNVMSTLNAKYAVLMDADNRRVLFEKDGYAKAPMASTTKIMTLLVALEYGNMDDIVTISQYAASMPDVQLNMCKDEQYRLGDLVYSLMLESHNDTAVAIAEHVGGSVEGFATLMNEKAQELGAYHTHFVTPNGLDAPEHYTTAYDLALISSYAIENKEFLKIVQTPTYTFYEQSKGRVFTVNNKNRFLNSYEGAIGIKTGFTGNAGYCFAGAVDYEGKHLVSVVLGCGWPPHKNYKWQDTAQLMNYGIQEYDWKKVLIPDTSFQKIQVTESVEQEPVTPYVKDLVALLLNKEEEVRFDVQVPKSLAAPVKKDQTVGEVTVYVNDEMYQVVPLYARESRRKRTYSYVLRQILYAYFLCGEG